MCLVLLLEVDHARSLNGRPVFALRNWLAERNCASTTQTLNGLMTPSRLGTQAANQAHFNPDQSSPWLFHNRRFSGFELTIQTVSDLPKDAVWRVGDSSHQLDPRSATSIRGPAHLERTIGRARSSTQPSEGWGSGPDRVARREPFPLLSPSLSHRKFLSSVM